VNGALEDDISIKNSSFFGGINHLHTGNIKELEKNLQESEARIKD